MYRKIPSDKYIHLTQDASISRADCFVIKSENQNFVFFEEYFIQKNRKGYLCVGVFDELSQTIKNTKRILEKNHHLSYPFVFQHKGYWYLIPESRLSKTIDLYRFTEFPYVVEYCKTLLENVDAVDSSIVEEAGKFFLFTSLADNGGPQNSNLSIFYSDDFLNADFLPHPCNPIFPKSGFGRMAGPLYRKGGRLYRPAQDCRYTYGRRVRHYEIGKLSDTEYEESLAETFLPPKGCMATHTYSRSEDYEFIDVKQNADGLIGVATNFLELIKVGLRKIWRHSNKAIRGGL